jgi:hypothetical protein
VVAGLATRLGLPYEQMDDLQLAVETILGKHGDVGTRTTIEFVVEPGSLRIHVGPVTHASIGDEPGTGDDLDTRRLLSALVESVEVVEHEGREWLRLEDGIRAG